MSGKSIRCLGFTLVELMVTVAIVAILLGIAIPSFTTLMQQNRLTAITNSLITSLSYARNEAIKRGHQVTMINVDGWSGGWEICYDVDEDESCVGDEQLRVVEALPDGYSITTGNSNYQDFATFIANGLPGPSNAITDTFTICQGADCTTSRAVIINAVGRARIE